MIFGAFLAFTKKLATSPKHVVRNVFAVMQNDCRSNTGSNIRNIMLNCTEDKHRPFSNVGIEKIELYPCPADATWKIPLIKELIEMRDGGRTSAEWTMENIKDTIDYLCTS